MEASEGPPEAADPGPTEPYAAPSIVRPMAAVIVTLVGGVLLALEAISSINNALTAPSWLPYSFLGLTGTPLLAWLLAGFAVGTAVAMSAYLLYAAPEWHAPLGGAILAFSLACIIFIPFAISTGGVVLGVVGGALGIGFRPAGWAQEGDSGAIGTW